MAHVTALEWAAIYAGVNMLILLVLAFATVRARISRKVVLGDGGDPVMQRAMRAHANAAEYIPAGIAGLILVGLLYQTGPAWMIHAGGGALTLGRILHGVGLSVGERNLGRALGTLLTWIAFLAIAIALIAGGLSQSL